MSLRSRILVSIACLSVTAGAHASTFGLAGSVGATPTFSISSTGLTATYSSPAGNGFVVQNTTGLLSFNTALLDNNFFGTDPLTISFSSPISGTILIPFAILDSYSTTDSLTVTANTGQRTGFLASPDSLPLGEPEGLATFSVSTPITSLTLSSAEAFAIGDVSTAVAATPEPTSLVLLVTGMAGVVLSRRRAR